MFEDSLVESQVFQVSSSKRWTTVASIGLQVAVAGVVIALPSLHPEALPFRVDAPKVLMPLIRKPPVPVVQTQREASAASSPMAVETTTRPPILPTSPHSGDAFPNNAPTLMSIGPGMGRNDGLLDGIGVGSGPAVSVAQAKGPVHVSTGVLQGMLIAPIRPVYPVIAKAAGVQGSVVVEAVISREGRIESLHVVSGPQMLQGAAIEAIRQARYQPYRLNGDPTEVQTTITVNFRMGG
jgi:periplasmic protein TonB